MYKSGETISFKYNADGLRVQKVATTTGTTNYTLHGKNIVHMTQGSNSLHFFYDANNKPAIVEYNGVKYAYVHNLQGDIVAILDSAGTKVVEYKYDAWGKPLSTTGTMANTLGKINPFRYRGYVYDEETGLYYLQSRYYTPENVRFLNADIYVSTGQGLLDGNMFAYCRNKPVILSDAAGTASGPLVYTGEADVDPTDDHENIGRCPGAGGGSTIRTYHAPNGGGGITSTYQWGSHKVTFGHGGRHLPATDNLSMVEYAIVQDIFSRGITGMPVGWYNRVPIPFDGHTLVYGAYVKEINHIHVGTFFYQDTK